MSKSKIVQVERPLLKPAPNQPPTQVAQADIPDVLESLSLGSSKMNWEHSKSSFWRVMSNPFQANKDSLFGINKNDSSFALNKTSGINPNSSLVERSSTRIDPSSFMTTESSSRFGVKVNTGFGLNRPAVPAIRMDTNPDAVKAGLWESKTYAKPVSAPKEVEFRQQRFFPKDEVTGLEDLLASKISLEDKPDPSPNIPYSLLAGAGLIGFTSAIIISKLL